eukprot:6178728-Pleurochrysis_carterae.AAC.1
MWVTTWRTLGEALKGSGEWEQAREKRCVRAWACMLGRGRACAFIACERVQAGLGAFRGL